MNRFPMEPTPPDANTARIYQDILANGFGAEQPINFFTALASRPDLLEPIWTLVKALLVDGEVPGSVKQMIALSISRQNACRYCSVVHRGALESGGVESDVVESCATDPETANLGEPHRSIVQFALKAARAPNSMTDEDFDRLADLALSPEEIAEVVMLAGFTNFINAWADISGIPLDTAA